MAAKGPLSKRILSENQQFSPVIWEHSHTVMDEDGRLKSFCVYSSPNTELLQEAASRTADATTKARGPTAPHPCPVRLCAIRFPPHKVGFGEIRSSRCPLRQLGQYSGDQILVRSNLLSHWSR